MNPKEEAEFTHQVRDALAHLYDHAYLQRHPLAARLVPAQAAATRTRGQELRRILLDAIEALNPGASVPMRAPERRAYAILFGLYVEGRGQPEVAASLGVGGRQLRRDRAAATEALVALVRDRYAHTMEAGTPRPAEEALRQESERLAQGRGPVDLRELVDGLLPLLDSMARERGVCLASHVGPDLPRPAANRTLVRQILIALASHALSLQALAGLAFEARQAGAAIGVGLALEYLAAAPHQALELSTAETLAAALGASLVREVAGIHGERVWVLLPLQDEAVVLVVDDNRELFALFERYVAGRPYRLVHAGSADEALALAKALEPDIVTLDLMMPGRDGWDLLQALRAGSTTSELPVIVCSVLEEPELALSLGARAFLKKPVGQADLLAALEAVKRQAWAEAGNRGSPAGR